MSRSKSFNLSAKDKVSLKDGSANTTLNVLSH